MKIYDNVDKLMKGLAQQVAEELRLAIKARGQASLSVPGGSTPKPFLNELSKLRLSWENVYVFLGDERFVDETSARSNTKLLKSNLLINEAENANLVPMYLNAPTPERALPAILEGLVAYLPIDVLVVGMGEDMHTASLFPDSENLIDALSVDAPPLMVVRAENAGEPRITLTGEILKSARSKHILIKGKAKRQSLARALEIMEPKIAPISLLLSGQNPPIIHYAE